MKRRWLVVLALVLLVASAGCAGLGGDQEDHPRAPDLDFADPDQRELVVAVLSSLDPADSDRFVDAITDENGLTPRGEAFLEQLAEIDRLGNQQRDAVATSIAKKGTVDEATIEAIERTLRSPEQFQVTVFSAGIVDTSGDGLLDGEAAAFGLDPTATYPAIADIVAPLARDGYDEREVTYVERIASIVDDEFAWQQVAAIGLLDRPVTNDTLAALRDSSGDGLLDGMATKLGLAIDERHDGVAGVAEPLAHGGYDGLAITYLERVATIAEYEGHPYEVWAQASELGLLDEAVADGSVDDEDLWAIENDADNRLINGMEVAFGTDPALADTSGDGYPDHLKWGPLNDLGLPVNPADPDVYVEVDATRGVDHPTDAQFEKIASTFENEPPDHIGPVNVHFVTCSEDIEPVSTVEEMSNRVANHREIRGLGVHYLLVNDGRFNLFGEDHGGLAWLGPVGEPFMLANGDLEPDAATSLIAHELGHKMGIFAGDFAGVDSTEYTFEEYNSVMNYNRTVEITFSTGPPFNDYEHMADRAFGSAYEPIDALEAMWDDGAVPTGPLC